MQSKLANKNAPRGALLGLAAATLLLAGAQSVLGQGASPVGFWDVVQSGARGGLASMQFVDLGTNGRFFSMNEIIVPNKPHSSIPVVGRGDNGTGRDPASNQGGDNNPQLPPHTDLFGNVIFPIIDRTNIFTNIFSVVNGNGVVITNIPYISTNILFRGVPPGQWGWNTEGKLIGFWTETSSASALITNVVPSFTNDYGQFSIPSTVVTVTNDVATTNTVFTLVQVTNIVYTTNVTAERLTNAISFTGKVTPGQRLTLNVKTPAGTVIFRGLPPLPLANVAGSWYGRKKNQGLAFYEFFDLTPFDSLRNIYDFQGSGPGYALGEYVFEDVAYGGGQMIISRQKRFAIAATVFTLGNLPQAPVVIRAVTGPFDINRGSFSGAKGIQGTGGSDDLRFNYNGAKAP
jgi:hypothetical protein